jgi:methylmalonyl-CoA/ethylmalonyl-CoA epimerase
MPPSNSDHSARRDAAPDLQFDHLGLVVRRLERGHALLTSLFFVQDWTETFQDEPNGVRCQFGRDGSGVVYELLEPLGKDSPVAAALAQRKSILNHVAYRVSDLRGSAERLAERRCAPTGPPRPAVAYGGRPVQFFVTPLNFIVELIEAPLHTHAFRLA